MSRIIFALSARPGIDQRPEKALGPQPVENRRSRSKVSTRSTTAAGVFKSDRFRGSRDGFLSHFVVSRTLLNYP